MCQGQAELLSTHIRIVRSDSMDAEAIMSCRGCVCEAGTMRNGSPKNLGETHRNGDDHIYRTDVPTRKKKPVKWKSW